LWIDLYARGRKYDIGIGDEIKEEFVEEFKEEAARKIGRGIQRWREGQRV